MKRVQEIWTYQTENKRLIDRIEKILTDTNIVKVHGYCPIQNRENVNVGFFVLVEGPAKLVRKISTKSDYRGSNYKYVDFEFDHDYLRAMERSR